MQRFARRLAGLSIVLALAGCATPPAPAASGVTYVLVRHAEKATDDPKDPALTDAGHERAQRLAASLHDAPVAAVYATAYRRTQQTAAPVAADHALPVTTYDAAAPAADVAARLRTAHGRGVVLVVGHSNTIPGLAQALCGCAIGPTADTEFGRRITIVRRVDGRMTVDDRREP